MPPSRSVYSLYYPEIVRGGHRGRALGRAAARALYERNYDKRQDTMHRGCLDGWTAWAGRAGVELGSGFAHHYPTAGASEGIHALLALQATHGGGRVHFFDGEYEGYMHTARALALPAIAHPRSREAWDEAVTDLRPGDTFWLSQPSAIDGNLWRDLDDFASLVEERAPYARLVVDLTYVGAVPGPLPIHLDRPGIAAVIWSLSKPFGVYYHRIGGLLSRGEIPSLRGHHWFKNLFSLALGERLMASFAPGELPERYRAQQIRAVAEATRAGTIDPASRPSDVVLLAHAPAGDARFADFRRGGHARFCLSPIMDAWINPTSPP